MLLVDDFKVVIFEGLLELGLDLGGFLVINIFRLLSSLHELGFIVIYEVLVLFV